MSTPKLCNLARRGFEQAACLVRANGREQAACRVTLREEPVLSRLIKSIHLSRPENYLSIYQSGCNLSCRKCHSWDFSKVADGRWLTPEEILESCAEYERGVTLVEPRERATSFHAGESCTCCGACVRGARSARCPGKLQPAQVVLSPQGYGPARNIAAFTGGDLTCRPAFYCRSAELIKEKTRLWVLIETNGTGLTDENLESLRSSGVDSFWLDIKAFDNSVHEWLTGAPVKRILGLPEKILKAGMVLEVLSLYIPGVVEVDQLEKVAALLARVEPQIPLTILAFFPEFKMKQFREPTLNEMKRAYFACREAGLGRVRLGNAGIFVKTADELDFLVREGLL
jgi:pyruvate formate lyase activating enzyme